MPSKFSPAIFGQSIKAIKQERNHERQSSINLFVSIGVFAFGLAVCYVHILDRNEFLLQIPGIAKSLTLFSSFRPGFSLLTMMMRRTKSKLIRNVFGRLNETDIGRWVSSPFDYALLFLDDQRADSVWQTREIHS